MKYVLVTLLFPVSVFATVNPEVIDLVDNRYIVRNTTEVQLQGTSAIELHTHAFCKAGDLLVTGGCENFNEALLITGSYPDPWANQPALTKEQILKNIENMTNKDFTPIDNGKSLIWTCKWNYKESLLNSIRSEINERLPFKDELSRITDHLPSLGLTKLLKVTTPDKTSVITKVVCQRR